MACPDFKTIGNSWGLDGTDQWKLIASQHSDAVMKVAVVKSWSGRMTCPGSNTTDACWGVSRTDQWKLPASQHSGAIMRLTVVQKWK